MIGVMVNLPGEAHPLRCFFAVGEGDRARAEWLAIDKAMLAGQVAESPHQGLEPVHVVSELNARTAASLALKPGEVRALGWKWPRRWLSL